MMLRTRTISTVMSLAPIYAAANGLLSYGELG
jgi:threonine/homoserine efflux transporter RhtA